jgi:hypothetical protein
MKNLTLLVICFFTMNLLGAQQQFSVPEVTSEQKQEILYNHVMGYALTGIGFAKSKGATPEEFGKYIGTQFKPFWNPNDGFPAFANGMLFILTGMHPANEIQIVEQSKNMVRFKLKNVDFMFKNGPAYGVTYKEFLDCSEGIISTLAQYMNVAFTHKVIDDWYEVSLKAK